MPGGRPLHAFLAVCLAAVFCGCVSPESVLRERRLKADVQSLQILQEQYRLPPAPPLRLEVKKAKDSAPGLFRLVVQEPGWELETPLEPIAVRSQPGAEATTFAWELPAERVSDRLEDAERTPPLLLHLWKGADHRPVVVPSRATEYRAGELAGAVLGGGLLVAAAPIWLPSHLLFTPIEKSRIAREQKDIVFHLPGEAAPASHPEAQLPFFVSRAVDARGRPGIRIAPSGTAWIPCEGSLLEALRRAIGPFQPELVGDIAEDPSNPGAFLVPLPRGGPGPTRPLLFLHQDCAGGLATGALWAFYSPAGGEWVKAWRLYEGRRPVKAGTPRAEASASR